MEKYVLVTGAFGGMGKATINLLAEKGYKVFALDKNIETVENANIIPIKADLTDENSIQKVFEEIKNITTELYAIIHFAGIYMLDSLVEMESKKFEKIFKINVNGAYLINKIFMPLLKKGSRIIITTSELAVLDPLPFTGIYAITKSALDKYAYSLKMELQLKDIKVSVLRAGAVATNMIGASTDALDGFCNNTKLYAFSSAKFKKIVDRVEARKVEPIKLAKKAHKILSRKNPKFAYKLNRNPLLLLLNALPQKFQFWVIKKILK
ncbi:MAG: SDR family NAD(P)-dependent oxidoreductase [Clostridiales bacterium]|nr:SDR family NAD(P)-dependent oxidoreductase [Clostridiales bacterium]